MEESKLSFLEKIQDIIKHFFIETLFNYFHLNKEFSFIIKVVPSYSLMKVVKVHMDC